MIIYVEAEPRDATLTCHVRPGVWAAATMSDAHHSLHAHPKEQRLLRLPATEPMLTPKPCVDAILATYILATVVGRDNRV
ncbi:hypothetical protein O1611_g4462 [Lasiodiplodia mahajangana]|uniref:Uncharacterized protein n=1 Tax=Lasiodiplodia mahajangana TaxID=1108764 RepID=A0ACC2JNU5_9PEZI|nr:hypothetical protein O1611_g4462 [Lasiodiplodia mahajangana]